MWITYLYLLESCSVPDGALFKQKRSKYRRSAVFKLKIGNVPGYQYFTSMMESEDRFLAQNRPKIIVQALVFPYNRSFNQWVAGENLYETNQVSLNIFVNTSL